MEVIDTGLPGARLIEPAVHGDDRGFFMETWRASRYAAAGLPGRFVQSNVSRSAHGILRGLHYQHPHPQGKLIWVLEGAIFDVAVDIRRGSSHFGRWSGAELSAANRRQFWVPEDYAHGFQVLSDSALVCYMVTSEFSPDHDRAIAWNDPEIGVDWPLEPRAVSPRDAAAPRLAELPAADLPGMPP